MLNIHNYNQTSELINYTFIHTRLYSKRRSEKKMTKSSSNGLFQICIRAYSKFVRYRYFRTAMTFEESQKENFALNAKQDTAVGFMVTSELENRLIGHKIFSVKSENRCDFSNCAAVRFLRSPSEFFTKRESLCDEIR